MDFRTLVFVTLLALVALLVVSSEAGKKRVVIHVPYKIKKVKHTHTIYKTIHHHHGHSPSKSSYGGGSRDRGYPSNHVVAYASPSTSNHVVAYASPSTSNHVVAFASPSTSNHAVAYARPAASQNHVVSFSKPIVPPAEPAAYASEVHEHVHHHHNEKPSGKHEIPAFEMPEFFHKHKSLVPVFKR